MPMLAATAAATARTRPVAALGRFAGGAATGRCEHGKLLGKFGGTAMRTLGTGPFARADQDFAVPLAFGAMKFVNRHGNRVINHSQSSSRNHLPCFTTHIRPIRPISGACPPTDKLRPHIYGGNLVPWRNELLCRVSSSNARSVPYAYAKLHHLTVTYGILPMRA